MTVEPELGQIGAQISGPGDRFDGVAYVVRQAAAITMCDPAWISMVR
jgi:hypothetical protein